MTAPTAGILPPPTLPLVAPRQPKGMELEHLGRVALNRLIGLHVEVKAPSWNQVLFSTRKLAIRLPRPPAEVLAALDQIPPADEPGMPPDAVKTEARLLLSGLSGSRPRPVPARSLAGGRPMPPPTDATSKWLRRLYLVTVGPDSLRLLAAAGYLTPDDIAVMETVYPKSLDEERKNAVAGALTFANAAARNRVQADLPAWLNDMLLTLMDEDRPDKYFRDIYKNEAKQQPGPSPSATAPDKIAEQSTPNPSVGR